MFDKVFETHTRTLYRATTRPLGYPLKFRKNKKMILLAAYIIAYYIAWIWLILFIAILTDMWMDIRKWVDNS